MRSHQKHDRLRSRLKCLKWAVKTWLQGREAASCYGNVNRLYWLAPSSIAAVSVMSRPPVAERGIVVDGDWDRRVISWDEFEPWLAFCHRYRGGGQWQQTAWYRSLLRRIATGRPAYGCRDAADLDRHFARTEELCRSIEADGFRLQTDLRPTGSFCEDEVTVHVDRDGHYLLADGRHRMCVALVLGLDRVPVKVARRHTQWVNFRRQVIRCAERGQVLQPLSHPDLADVPAPPAYAAVQFITQHVPPGATIIDLTAGWGYYCGQFEDARCNCIATEPSAENQYFLKRLHFAERRRFTIIDNPYIAPEGPTTCDAVLALNAGSCLQWMGPDRPSLLDLLRRVQTRLVFVQPHPPSGERFAAQHVGHNPERLVDLVADAAATPNRTIIGEMAAGRPIYMLWR